MLRLLVLLAGAGLVLAGAAALGRAADAGPVSDSVAQASPNGRYLTFLRQYPSSSDRYAPTTRLALWVTDSEGTNQVELLQPEVTSSAPRHWWTPTNLVAIRTAAGTVYRRPSDGAVVATPTTDDGSLSPDGVLSYSEENGVLSISRADGSDRRAVAKAPGGFFGGETWSPDSSELAYTIADRAGFALEIVNADGSDRRRLFVGVAGFPVSWSPDSRRVAFGAQLGGKLWHPAHVYVAAANGSRPRELAGGYAGRGTDDPDWSPRGDWIAYEVSSPPSVVDIPRVALTRPDGTGTHLLLGVHATANENPAWLDGGTKLAFTMRGTCARDGVYTIGVDGKHLRRLTNRC